MPKNITYHQTAAQKARRTRNDSAQVGTLGLAGVAATQGKRGFTDPAVRGNLKASGAHLKHAAKGKMDKMPSTYTARHLRSAKSTAQTAQKLIHPGRGLAEAAVGAGAAGVVTGEARNIYHTRKEQKLRRNRISKAGTGTLKLVEGGKHAKGIIKGMPAETFADPKRPMGGKRRNDMVSKAGKYCKQHGKFDACSEKKGSEAEQPGNPDLKTNQYFGKAYKARPKPGDPAFMGHAIKNAHKRHRAALKAMKDDGTTHLVSKGDDGIIHLTGTSQQARSSEHRGTGMLVPVNLGSREFDGTPMMGSGPKGIQPKDRAGSSGSTKPVGGAPGIKEQVPGHGKKSVAKRDFSTKQREKLAAKGDALPDGSFPIKTKKDLKNAEKLEGHSKHPAEVEAFIDRKKAELSKGYEMGNHDAFFDGGISKKFQPQDTSVRATGKGRYLVGPALAAKDGSKARASKRTLGHVYAGEIGGGVGGAVAGAATHKKYGPLAGALIGAQMGATTGARMAADKNAQEGLLKPKYVTKK